MFTVITHVSFVLVCFHRFVLFVMSNVQRTPPSVSGINRNTTNKRMRNENHDRLDSANNDVNVNSITLEGMMMTMMKQFTETRQLIDTVRNEIKDVNNKIDDVKIELKADIKSVKDECKAKFQHYDAALESVNKRVDDVTREIAALQNRNELIISGIPMQPDENLNSTLTDIGKYLAVKDTSNLMATTRRMKSGSSSHNDGLVAVEFALKATRDEFYSAYLRKRDLKLKHIGLNSDRRIYINESLSTEARKLKSAALHLKKAGKLASVYTKQGIVYVKKAADGSAVVIKSEVELDKFL